ncbi:MAG: hypothetical protein MZV49_21000 [Rhodopseudomonas palustris]|nr:hypothetical protein [Rhodopseudomonas palustris]
MNTTHLAHWKRPLDRAETFFWFLDRFSSMNFAVIAEGRGTLADAALQAALDAAQRRHPLLTVAVEADAERRLNFVSRPTRGISAPSGSQARAPTTGAVRSPNASSCPLRWGNRL